ncbi:MAG: TetR/AcrR family transcriptional regulator C-terminal domain-containing protein [Clostridia bacterium]|nr:TetR/AcrR family transcriptional regulator C-terminal domain-containing protein [Clostridia bacterium]
MEKTAKTKKTYRNFTRSEKAIIRAYVELMEKKGSGRISVTDIVNVADLNRSTFYAHFKSAEDVREKIHTDIITEITGILEAGDFTNSLSNPRPVLRRILDFIKSDETLYKRLLRTGGAMKFMKQLEGIVIERFLSDEIILPQIKARDDFEMTLRLVMGGFISVLQDWAEDNIKVPLERVIEIMEGFIRDRAEAYRKRT